MRGKAEESQSCFFLLLLIFDFIFTIRYKPNRNRGPLWKQTGSFRKFHNISHLSSFTMFLQTAFQNCCFYFNKNIKMQVE